MTAAWVWLRRQPWRVWLGAACWLYALAAVALWVAYRSPAGQDTAPRLVHIHTGTGVRQMAAQLHAAGVLQRPWLFVLYARLGWPAPALQAGEYALQASMSPADILAVLRQGKVFQHVVTIPEGATLREVARLIMGKGLGESQRLMALGQDRAFIASLGLSGASLEGYLFPDTYHIPRDLSAQALLTRMVRNFHAHYTADIAAQAQRLGLSQHEVVILASLIEKEAQLDAERPLIAAVWLNRLRRGMRLQCDATVVYALGERFDGNVRKDDLQLDSPYNTYRYAGLPPGPIANPGQRALEAAVNPAAVDYLYFVAAQEGGRHIFSKSLPEHNVAVRQHQLAKQRSRAALP